MSEARIVDYYAVLNLPPHADLAGIENAYTRLADELASRVHEDDTAGWALERVNEAYGVLSRADRRREYDQIYFSKEIAELQHEELMRERRRAIAGTIMVGALLSIVAVQSIVLGMIGREYIDTALDFVLGPLMPGGSG